LTDQESPAAPDPEFQLGVLLVHGIGTQRPGETLVRWGDVLLKTIESATRKGVTTTVERAPTGPGRAASRRPCCCGQRIAPSPSAGCSPNAGGPTLFLLRPIGSLCQWSVRALPWSIVTYIAVQYWQAPSRRQRVVALVELLGALGFAPVLVALLGLALLVGLLPIPQIRTAILAAQSKLTATIGDSFAFVESPVRAGLIRTCILDNSEQLKWLEPLKGQQRFKGQEQPKPRCKHTVIVAHSQGAAVVLEALGGMSEPGEKREPKAGSHGVPDALVTFGAGTNQLASQKVLSGLPKTMRPVWGATGALFSALGVMLWLYLSMELRQTTLENIFWSFFLVLLASFGSMVILTVIWLTLFLALWVTSASGLEIMSGLFFLAEILSTSVLIGVGILIWYGGHALLPLYLLVLTLFYLFGSMRLILSEKMKTVVTAPVSVPEGVGRWVDLYASADPVPNGPTRTEDAGGYKSIQISNLGSILSGPHRLLEQP
jgi:hypothetical protein